MNEPNNIDLKAITLNNDIQESVDLIKLIDNDKIEKNLNEVLKTVHHIDIKCDFKKCKQKTHLVGYDCKLCKKRYCMAHTLPEVHGCGEAVKQLEHDLFRKPPSASTKLKEKDHEKAKDNLANKLKSMQNSRKPIVKPKKKVETTRK